jgi:hypothetical protein
MELSNLYESALIISTMSPDRIEQFWKYLFVENTNIYNQANMIWIIDHRNSQFFLEFLDLEVRGFQQLQLLNEILLNYAWWDLQINHPDQFLKVMQQLDNEILQVE